MTTQQAGFLDFATALEAALLSGISDELAYRVCLYGLLFLGDERDSHESFEKLKKIYDVRSKVVHGSRSKRRKGPPQTLLRRIWRVLSLGKAIESGWPNAKDLDQRARSGNSATKM